MALVTAAEVRTAGLPTVSGTGLDASLIEIAIDDAESMIAGYLRYPTPTSGGITLASVSYTVYATGRESGLTRHLTLPFPGNRITAITTVHEDPAEEFGASTLLASTSYSLRADKGTLTRTDGNWSTVEGSVKVVFVAGWTTGTVEKAVKRAIIQATQHILRLRSELGHESTSIPGGGSTSKRAETLPESVEQALAPYVLMPWEV